MFTIFLFYYGQTSISLWRFWFPSRQLRLLWQFFFAVILFIYQEDFLENKSIAHAYHLFFTTIHTFHLWCLAASWKLFLSINLIFFQSSSPEFSNFIGFFPKLDDVINLLIWFLDWTCRQSRFIATGAATWLID